MDAKQPIYSQVHETGASFISLESALRQSERYAIQIKPETVKDEFDRFKIWAGNVAAHLKGRRSLEYRLRDASHLKLETKSLLQALHDSLRNAELIAMGEKTPWDEFTASDGDSDSDSGSETGSAGGGEGTELKQLIASIKATVTCLFRLSMAIRDPAPDSQLGSTITVDKSYFEAHDIWHTTEKFPECQGFLKERLGRAISGRRAYLSYREAHHQKLAKNVETIGFEAPRTVQTTNSTEATPIPKTDQAILDDGDALSQTSYATSVNANIRVPKLPKVAHDEEHFECPLCFMIVSIHTTAGWKAHVYRDLHPYSCTFKSCPTADRLYDSRHSWFMHELEAHRGSWQCVEGCEKTFSDEEGFDCHVIECHSDLSAPRMRSALKQTAARRPNLTDASRCPLCCKEMPLRTMQKHLAHHMEQLALFALPPNLDATEDQPADEEQDAVDISKWQEKQDENEQVSDLSSELNDTALYCLHSACQGSGKVPFDDVEALAQHTTQVHGVFNGAHQGNDGSPTAAMSPNSSDAEELDDNTQLFQASEEWGGVYPTPPDGVLHVEGGTSMEGQAPKSFTDQPPEQLVYDGSSGSVSNYPTSVRTPDHDSFEFEMLDGEMRDFFHNQNTSWPLPNQLFRASQGWEGVYPTPPDVVLHVGGGTSMEGSSGNDQEDRQARYEQEPSDTQTSGRQENREEKGKTKVSKAEENEESEQAYQTDVPPRDFGCNLCLHRFGREEQLESHYLLVHNYSGYRLSFRPSQERDSDRYDVSEDQLSYRGGDTSTSIPDYSGADYGERDAWNARRHHHPTWLSDLNEEDEILNDILRTQPLRWSTKDDEILIQLRAQGVSWNQMASEHFPSKTGNACRKRHERLMERRNAKEQNPEKSAFDETKLGGILRKPTEKFPEDSSPIRAGVGSIKDPLEGKEIPPGSRWTKIDRRLVNPQALVEANERFEERLDCVIVLRILTKEEIQKLADRTKEIRDDRLHVPVKAVKVKVHDDGRHVTLRRLTEEEAAAQRVERREQRRHRSESISDLEDSDMERQSERISEREPPSSRKQPENGPAFHEGIITHYRHIDQGK